MNDEDVVKDIRVYSIEYVLGKYGLTFKELVELCKAYYSDKEDGRYVSKTKSGNFRIMKYKDNYPVYYGVYSSESDAELIVEELKKVNWDYDKLDDIISFLNIKSKRSKR